MVQRDLPALRVAVVGAQGPSAERRFAPGVVAGPISIGRQGDWALEGRGVGALDGFLYYDGRELFACSRDASAPMLLDGRPLGTSWEPLPLGAIVVVGRLRLVVEDPTPAPDSSSTILTDLEALKAPPAPVPGGVFSRDDEHTRVGEALPSATDLDDQPTAFLSASVRDAVREGLAQGPARAPEPRAVAPSVSTPTHVLRVDHRVASTPPPVQGHRVAGADSPFFAAPPSVAQLPAEPMSLPRLSDALPLYGVGKAPRDSGTDPPAAPASVAPSTSLLARVWRDANGVRKATMVLLPVALAAFAFVVFAPESPAPRARAEAPTAALPTATPAPPAETEPLTPRVLAGSSGLAKAPDGGVTLERLAVDAVAAHRLDEASALYKELAASEPKNAAFSAAARVLAAPPTGAR
jgi:hypothetical protein